MKDKVLEFLNKYNLTDKTIIVGFSGGHDSMCLLDILFKLSTKYPFKLIAAHFNHNWRGVEAKMEQDICRKFCEDRQIEFYTKTAALNIKQSEAVARAMRYDFFNRAIQKYNADALFTAHNKNDNAETILYRVIKGTGVTGLKGIAEKRDNIYRPLIDITRDDIDEYCQDNNLIPNNDSSNENVKYKRNFIRHKLIPMAEEINENVLDSLTSLARVAADESRIIDEYMHYVKSVVMVNDSIVTERYINMSPAVKRKLIYDLVTSQKLDYDSQKIYEIYDFIEQNRDSNSGTKMSLSSGLWLYVSSKIIELVVKTPKLEDEVLVRLEGSYEIGDYIFEISTYAGDDISSYPPDNSYTAYINLTDVDLDFVLRTRKDGDIINPLGMSGSMKLKKYLISKSVPQHKKDDLILLCTPDNEVLWVAGLGLSNKIQVTDKPTHKITLRKK